jgi:hypothetical protein
MKTKTTQKVLTSRYMEAAPLTDPKLIHPGNAHKHLPRMHKHMQTRFATIPWPLEPTDGEIHYTAAEEGHGEEFGKAEIGGGSGHEGKRVYAPC